MKSKNPNNIGSWIALLIGLPFGTFFSLLILFLSLFPILDIVIAIIGGRLFWHPIIWEGVIPITFTILLWIAGGKIKKHLDKNYSVLMTSFLFTFFVNSWLFGLFLLIFLVGGLFFNPLQSDGFSRFSLIAIFLTFFTYIFSTALTTFTLGLLIVTITKHKLSKIKIILD